MLRKSLFASALILLAAGVAFGQNAAPVHLTGTIESLENGTLSLTTPAGNRILVSLPANVRILKNIKSSLADIHRGDFVGAAAVKGSDGRLHAQEVHIFPEAMRGVGEGHRPMGPNPDRTMTNGDVSKVRSMTNGTVSGVAGSASRVLTVTYKGGKQEIEVSPSTPVIRMVLANKALLKPGVAVSVLASITKTGVVARAVNVEEAK
ncbi:MAG TPA: hypothetical protein VNJ52_12230 [Patescibacteria group bacterium]|nr:hypothetical protein [Patescibacteria group bacterium]